MSQTTLFDILSNGERIIVHSREDHSQIYTWNQSLTLQCWDVALFDREKSNSPISWFEEVDVLTLSSQPRDYYAARFMAIEWCNSNAPVVNTENIR